ncbi:hypothetical protein D9M68_886440 [compost metagenome]
MQCTEISQCHLHRRQVGHVQLGMPDIAQLRGQFGEGTVVDIEQADLPAARVKQTCRRRANPRGGASNQDVIHQQPRSRRKLTTRPRAKSAALSMPACA